jgi:hypothetical protein
MKRQTKNRAAQMSFARINKCGSQEPSSEAILEREAKPEKRRFDLIRDVLLDFEPTLAEEEEHKNYQTAFVLLAALSCGSDISSLVRFTHLPVDLIATVRHPMLEAELWTESNTFCEHWFTSDRLNQARLLLERALGYSNHL